MSRSSDNCIVHDVNNNIHSVSGDYKDDDDDDDDEDDNADDD